MATIPYGQRFNLSLAQRFVANSSSHSLFLKNLNKTIPLLDIIISSVKDSSFISNQDMSYYIDSYILLYLFLVFVLIISSNIISPFSHFSFRRVVFCIILFLLFNSFMEKIMYQEQVGFLKLIISFLKGVSC